MSQSIPTSFVSGLTDAFHSTLPKGGTPPGTPPSAGGTPAAPAGKIAPPSGFSNEIKQVGQTGQMGPKPGPVAQSSSPTGTSNTGKLPPTSFNMKAYIPAGVGAMGAGLGSTGASLNGSAQQGISSLAKMFNPQGYSASELGSSLYNQFGQYGGIRKYLGQPQNFAQILGALSPIASPLLRTAGMPLMLGAYSALKDPHYANELTNGAFPKIGVALPEVGSPPADHLDFRPPDLLGKVQAPTPVTQANAVRLAHSVNGQLPNLSQEIKPDQKSDLLDAGLSTGALAGNAASHLIKNPGLKRFAGRALGSVGSIAELAGVPEYVRGAPPRPLSEIATGMQNNLNPAHWAGQFAQVQNDPAMLPWEKVVGHVGNALSNPATVMLTDPVGTGVGAAKTLDDLTGATNMLYLATGGQYGTEPRGKTLSLPGAMSAMSRLRSNQPMLNSVSRLPK